jgi:hypothetical protein
MPMKSNVFTSLSMPRGCANEEGTPSSDTFPGIAFNFYVNLTFDRNVTRKMRRMKEYCRPFTSNFLP